MLTDENIDLVASLMDLEFYRFTRYKIPSTIAIFDSKCGDVFHTITNAMRKTDLCQYISSEKFVILLSHTHSDDAKRAIEKFLLSLDDKCIEQVYVGYSTLKPGDSSSETIIKRANEALKKAHSTNQHISNL